MIFSWLLQQKGGKKLGYVLTKEAFDKVLKKLAEKRLIYAPVLKVGEGRFTDTDVVRYDYVTELSQIELSKKSDYAFKEILTPLSETLFFFTENEVKTADRDPREVIDEKFRFGDKVYNATCLTVGNPHCIIFTGSLSAKEAKNLGPYVENSDEFPNRMNLQLCRVIDRGNLDIEIWERGSGYTRASGTGSCAAAAAAYRLGYVEPRINVNQPGGMIQIDIAADGTIFMTGTVGYIAEMTIAEGFFS